jgi:hypothetical protein
MIALVVLAVALLGTMTFNHTIGQGQDRAHIQLQVSSLMRQLVERIEGAPWTDLSMNKPGLKWTKVSFEDDTPNIFVNAQDLINEGILEPRQRIASSQDLNQFKLYVEYYQVIPTALSNSTDPSDLKNFNLMDNVATATSSASFNQWFATKGNRNAVRLRPDTISGLKFTDVSPSPGENDPILIRLVFRWGAGQRSEIWTGCSRIN